MVSYDAQLETAVDSGYSFDIPDYEADPLKILEKREDALEISEDEQYHGWAADGPYDKWRKGLEEKPSESWLEMLEEHCALLSMEDRRLCTYAEIAVIAGFSSHSGVIGRLKRVMEYCKITATRVTFSFDQGSRIKTGTSPLSHSCRPAARRCKIDLGKRDKERTGSANRGAP